MPIHNVDIADILNQVADLLEIEGANPFRVRAYRNAARTVATLSSDVAEKVKKGEDLTELEGIGESIAEKIAEIVRTGGLEQLQEVEQRTPPELAQMLNIPGLGPKRVQAIHEILGVSNLEELEKAAKEGEIQELNGLGEKTEQKIIENLQDARGREKRTRLDVARELAKPLVAYLREIEGVRRVQVAGSYRRWKETVGDLDILVIGADAHAA